MKGGEIMTRKRKKLTRRGSRRLFSATGVGTHKRNLAPPPMRGGYRI